MRYIVSRHLKPLLPSLLRLSGTCHHGNIVGKRFHCCLSDDSYCTIALKSACNQLRLHKEVGKLVNWQVIEALCVGDGLEDPDNQKPVSIVQQQRREM